MRCFRLKSLPLAIALIFALLAAPVSSLGYVWCLGTNGHAEVEMATAGDCSVDCESSSTEHDPALALSAGDKDCGPCLDISSSHQGNISRSRQSDVSFDSRPDFTPVAPASSAVLPILTLNTHSLIDSAPRTPGPILHHRTTVLLI